MEQDVFIPSFLKDEEEQGSPTPVNTPETSSEAPSELFTPAQVPTPLQTEQTTQGASEGLSLDFLDKEQEEFETRKLEDSAPSGMNREQLMSNEDTMSQIRDYMVLRKGVKYASIPEEELYDDWVNHMRFFSTNEINTIGELRFVDKLDEKDKNTAANAYMAFDSLGSVFTNDGIGGAVDGVFDYTRAALISPSTWLGMGVGKIVTQGALQGGKKLAFQNMIDTARQQAVQNAIKRGATAEAAETAGEQVVRSTIASATKSRAIKEVTAAAVTDAALSSFQDYAYQSVLLDVGAQDDYNIFQTGLVGLTGGLGGVVAGVPYLSRGSSGLGDAGQRISTGQAKRAIRDSKKLAPALTSAVKAFKGAMADWAKSVGDGKVIAKDSVEVRQKAAQLLLDPNPESPTSIVGAMIRTNTALRRGADEPTIAHQLISFAKALPEEKLVEFDNILKEATDITYREYLDILAAYASESGKGLKLFKDVGDIVGKHVAAKQHSNKVLASTTISKTKDDPKPEVINYITSLWRRALVSHPATTVVNVQGWLQAAGTRSISEIIQASVMGGAGLVGKMVNAKFSDEALAESGRLFSAQLFKLKTLLDPYSTKEAFISLVEAAPKNVQRSMRSDTFGGVSSEGAERYKLNPKNFIVKKSELAADRLASASLLKAQDMYTKSFSFVYKLDQQARKELGIDLEEVINSGRLNDLSQDAWEAATRNALEDTFSADYTRGNKTLNNWASVVEKVSNTPGLGFLFPFGRFMNNALAFVMQYSPIGVYPFMQKGIKNGFFSGDAQESLAKALTGSLALATLVHYQGEKRKQGLAWNQELSTTGDVYNRDNLAPASSYMLVARIIDLMIEGEKVPDSLWAELPGQLGSAQFLESLGQANPVTETVALFGKLSDEEEQSVMATMIGGLGSKLAEIGSGFTRPLEPINVVLGVGFDTDTRLDTRVLEGGDKVAGSLMRYVDNIFVPFIGEENREGRKTIGPAQEDSTEFGPAREENPIARLVGDRIERPFNDIDIMLNKVDLPAWTIQERSDVPEFDALLRREITPLLNLRAKQVMETSVWRQGNIRTRERLARNVIKEVRRITVDRLEKDMTSDETLLVQRRNLLTLPRSLRVQAKDHFGINKHDRELTFYEIKLITDYIELRRDYEEDLNRDF